MDDWQSTPVFGVSGASPPVLENLGEVASIKTNYNNTIIYKIYIIDFEYDD